MVDLPPARGLGVIRGLLFVLGCLALVTGAIADIVRYGQFDGIGWAQITMMAAGLLTVAVAWGLPSQWARVRLEPVLKHPGRTLLLVVIYGITAVLAVEAALAIRGSQPVYSHHRQAAALTLAPWWQCDPLGCRFDAKQPRSRPAAMPEGARRQPAEVFFERLQVVNAQGFHDSDDFSAPPNPDGSLRILALGDSFTFGFYAHRGESWIERWEERIGRERDVVLWNTGIPGAATVQELAVLKHYLPLLRPNLVILGFYPGNDLEGNLYPTDNFYASTGGSLFAKYKIGPDFEPIAMSPASAFYRATRLKPATAVGPLENLVGRTRAGTAAIRSWAALRPDVEWIWSPQARRVPSFERKRLEAETRTERLLTTMQAAVKAQGGRFVAVLIPGPQDLVTPGTRYAQGKAILERLSIEIIEVLDGLTPGDYLPGDEHWNSEGHAKVGRIVAKRLPAN